MKDYTIEFEDKKLFILNYEVIDKQIKVNLASGENYYIPYTSENEEKLLERMKWQVSNVEKFETKVKKRIKSSRIWLIVLIITLIMNLIMWQVDYTYILGLSDNVMLIFNILIISWNAFDIVNSKRKINDINKQRILLNNQEELNEKVKENQNILSNINEHTKEMLLSTPKEEPVFTLNSIHKMKYKELRQIYENLLREKEFDFDYSTSNEEDMKLDRKRKL